MHWFSRYDIVRRWLAQHSRRTAHEERSRLARDLHDGLAQDLYAANLVLSSLRDRVPAEVTPKVDELIDRHVLMLDDMRRLVDERVDRHSLTAGTLSLDSLVEDLTDLTRRELDNDPMIEVEMTAPDRVRRRLSTEATFALREMISNAVRHSESTTIVVMVDAGSDRLSLCVADDGCGIPAAATPGRGLENLRFRARRCGGRFSVSSWQGVGTTARWVVPWSCRGGASLRPAA